MYAIVIRRQDATQYFREYNEASAIALFIA
jgi:hypothetical protein